MVKPTRLVNELGISSKTEDGGDRCGRKKVGRRMMLKRVHAERWTIDCLNGSLWRKIVERIEGLRCCGDHGGSGEQPRMQCVNHDVGLRASRAESWVVPGLCQPDEHSLLSRLLASGSTNYSRWARLDYVMAFMARGCCGG